MTEKREASSVCLVWDLIVPVAKVDHKTLLSLCKKYVEKTTGDLDRKMINRYYCVEMNFEVYCNFCFLFENLNDFGLSIKEPNDFLSKLPTDNFFVSGGRQSLCFFRLIV